MVVLTFGENDAQLEKSSLPQSLLLAWDTALPCLEIENALTISLWLCVEAEWVVSTPLLAFLLETVLAERHSCGLIFVEKSCVLGEKAEDCGGACTSLDLKAAVARKRGPGFVWVASALNQNIPRNSLQPFVIKSSGSCLPDSKWP